MLIQMGNMVDAQNFNLKILIILIFCEYLNLVRHKWANVSIANENILQWRSIINLS